MKLRNKKTGEIQGFGNLQVYAETENTDESQLLGNFNSFGQILEYYEDYIPKGPLIKDEKIRRELSEWIALYGEHEKIKYFRYNDFVVFRLCRKRGTPEPEISLPTIYDCDSLREGKEYTKPELCGEEEE